MAAKYLAWTQDVGGTERTVKLPLSKFDATAAPTGSDDSTAGYKPGSIWINTTTSKVYQLVSEPATGSAAWVELSATGPPGIPGRDGEDGQDSLIPGPLGPTGATGAAGANGATGPQ